MIFRNLYVLAILAVACVLAAYWMFGHNVTRDYQFAYLGLARDAGLIENGTIPAWVPFSARNINVRHEVKRNERLIRFTYSGNPEWVYRTPCAPARLEQLRQPRIGASWWPADIPPRQGRPHSYQLYTCGSLTSAYMAIDRTSDAIYVWIR